MQRAIGGLAALLLLGVLSPAPTSANDATPTPSNTAPSDALTPCRIPDQRTSKTVPGAIAHPVSTSNQWGQLIPSTGTVKVAVIPIDFPDVPGKSTPQQMFGVHQRLVDDWIRWFSHDRLKYEYQMSPTWIRAPKPSSKYVWKQPWFKQPAAYTPKSYLTSDALVPTFMSLASDKYDYTDVQIVLFLYPKEIKYQADLLTRFFRVRVDGQNYNMQTNAIGSTIWTWNQPIWLWFLHENLHPHGLAGHAPGGGGALGIMQGPRTSLVATAWEQVILGWDSPDEIVCLDASTMSASQDFTLTALELQQAGTKAVMVRLSDHQVLVIESHRQGRWGNPKTIFPIASERPKTSGLPATFKGVTVTLIDTTVDRNRRSWHDQMFAQYLYVPGVNRNRNAPKLYDPFDWNALLKKGDAVTSGGVRVAVVAQTAMDTVRISRA